LNIRLLSETMFVVGCLNSWASATVLWVIARVGAVRAEDAAICG